MTQIHVDYLVKYRRLKLQQEIDASVHRRQLRFWRVAFGILAAMNILLAAQEAYTACG